MEVMEKYTMHWPGANLQAGGKKLVFALYQILQAGGQLPEVLTRGDVSLFETPLI